ncbi:7TM diverse intracellular signaling domain-containing protein [Pseudomonas sp. EA_105y_Pfl2_R69]|uniref:7TM diverse intracellular signaling domain-containing protein n=1 Tax=Pseudomonas sp. EA_105y_Pfl2_R69 TaxID=3088683 RepID=UPI0030DDAFFE
MFAGLLLGLCAGLAQAEVGEALIAPQGEVLNLSSYLQLLEDPGGQLSLEQVQAADFRDNQADSANFGFSHSAWWVRFHLSNPSEQTRQLLLRQDYPLIDWLEFWSRQPDGSWQVRSSGDRRPFASREIQHRDFIFSLELPPHSEQTYYLRFASAGPINIGLSLSSTQALLERIGLEQLAYGCYYGALLSLLLYNLFMLLVVRDRAFFFYLLYVSCYGLYMAVHNGLAYQFLWPQSPSLANDSLLLLLGMSLLWALQFARDILTTRKLAPRLDRLSQVLQGGCVLLMLGIPAFSYGQLIQPFAALTLVITLQLLLLGVVALLAGARPARYFLLAWSALLIGVLIYMLKTFGWLPHNMLTQNAFQLGALIEMLLLSLALGSRVRELKRGSYLDALTGLGNRRHFDSQLHEELPEARRLDRPLSLLLLDVDHFKRFNDEHGHQAGDRALQTVARLLQCEVRKPFIACRHGGEEFAVIMPNSSVEDARVLAERLRRELARLVEGEALLALTLSIGLASLADGPFERPEQLFAAADQALYAAKHGGRDQVACYQGLALRSGASQAVEELPAGRS